MSAKIEKIVLEIGDKKVELSPEEAEELKALLSDLFDGERMKSSPALYSSTINAYWPRKYWEGSVFWPGGVGATIIYRIKERIVEEGELVEQGNILKT